MAGNTDIPTVKTDGETQAPMGATELSPTQQNAEIPVAETAAKTKPRTLKKILSVIYNFFIATVCGLTFGFTIQGFVISMAQDSVLGSRDYVVFWATGQQLAHHANPYDPAGLLRLERGAGLSTRYNVMYMRNLPAALPLVYPLGLLGLRAGSILWTVVLLGCLAGSVYILWVMHGRQNNHRHWLGYSFGPALICAIMGQTSLFALLGLVLFLRLHRTRPYLAGASLWLCMLKPHLFLPFGVVLLAWVAVTRSYKLLIGGAVAMAASCALAYRIDPMAWIEYGQMARGSGIGFEFIPCMSVLLRNWISKGTVWLQYAPAALACIWALGYYWTRRAKWDWMSNGSLLMVVGVLAAPYAWIYDACILIPALLQGAYVTRSRNVLIALAFLSALVEAALFGNILKPSAIYLWTLWSAPAWFAWYVVASTPPAKWAAAWSSLRAMKWFRAGDAAQGV
jgi:hypothetical protein